MQESGCACILSHPRGATMLDPAKWEVYHVCKFFSPVREILLCASLEQKGFPAGREGLALPVEGVPELRGGRGGWRR